MILCYMNIEISAIALSSTYGMLLEFLKGNMIQYRVRFTMLKYFKYKKTYAAHKIKYP